MSISPPEPEPAVPVRRGRAALAWLVIVGVVVLLLLRNREEEPAVQRHLGLTMMEMQGRLLVGQASLLDHKAQVFAQARSLDTGTYGQRLRFAVLAGELAGPAEARKCLRTLDEEQAAGQFQPPPTEEQLRVTRLLERLYRSYEQDPQEAVELSEGEREELRQELGWYGELALVPPGGDAVARDRVLAPARRSAAGFLTMIGVLLLAGVAGFVALILFAAAWLAGRLRDGLVTGSPYGGVYAETFALYLLIFLGLSYAFAAVPARQYRLLLSGLAALLSLTALAWPVLRGVPWRQVRHDVGWFPGRDPLLEPLIGVGCYAAALPVVFVGLIVLLIWMKLQQKLGLGPVQAPAHPIAGYAAGATWWTWVQVVLVASGVAPLVEETMFRGVLYRHLRELTGTAGRGASVLVSAVVVSFIFAVIHPQGFLAVPVLAALAFVFALAREWRGTLIPSMVAHGVNNGVAAILLILLAG